MRGSRRPLRLAAAVLLMVVGFSLLNGAGLGSAAQETQLEPSPFPTPPDPAAPLAPAVPAAPAEPAWPSGLPPTDAFNLLAFWLPVAAALVTISVSVVVVWLLLRLIRTMDLMRADLRSIESSTRASSVGTLQPQPQQPDDN